VAKSVLSALIGIAVEEWHIASIRDPIGAHVPAVRGSCYGDVPIEDALTMSSGVAFDENYENPMSDTNMLFIRAMAMGVPAEETLARLERVRAPGAYSDYVSSDSMALGLTLEAATEPRRVCNRATTRPATGPSVMATSGGSRRSPGTSSPSASGGSRSTSIPPAKR
jgi:CubicO group peptidase (beta-lactamase class C family)